MPLHPQVQAHLERLAALNVAGLHTVSPEQARAGARRLTTARPEPVFEVTDSTIADGLAREADTQASQLYQPGTGAAQPVETRQYASYTQPVQGPVRQARATEDGEQVETRRYARYATPVRLDQGLVRRASGGDSGEHVETRDYAVYRPLVHKPVRLDQVGGDGEQTETRRYATPALTSPRRVRCTCTTAPCAWPADHTEHQRRRPPGPGTGHQLHRARCSG